MLSHRKHTAPLLATTLLACLGRTAHAAPCDNASIHLTVGDHWEYDVKGPSGEALGAVAIEVVSANPDGSLTVRGLSTSNDDLAIPAQAVFECRDGAWVRRETAPLGLAPGAPAPPRSVESALSTHGAPKSTLQTLSMPLSTRLWGYTGKAHQIKMTLRQVGQKTVQTSTGALEGVRYMVEAQSRKVPHLSTAENAAPTLSLAEEAATRADFVVSEEGLLEASGEFGSIRLRSKATGQSTPALREAPEERPAPELAPLDLWMAEREGAPAPTPITPGLSGDLCSKSFQRHMAVKLGACMVGVSAAIPFGVFFAERMCRRVGGRDEEWQAIDSTPQNVHRVATVLGVVKTAPAPSNEDFCMTHEDRDLDFQIQPLKDGKPDGSLLSSLNQGLMEIEWETMYVHPFHRSLKWPRDAAPEVDNLGLPWPGDFIAVHGPFIADCGHPEGKRARTEVHPPTLMAWSHPTSPRTFRVWIRASTRPIGSGGSYVDAQPDVDVVLPLGAALAAHHGFTVDPVTYDYGIVKYGA